MEYSLEKNILKYVPLFKVVSFDNLSIKQLNLQEQIESNIWEEFYMGDDGKFTMYIDLVKKKFSKNSINDQVFDLKSDIRTITGLSANAAARVEIPSTNFST